MQVWPEANQPAFKRRLEHAQPQQFGSGGDQTSSWSASSSLICFFTGRILSHPGSRVFETRWTCIASFDWMRWGEHLSVRADLSESPIWASLSIRGLAWTWIIPAALETPRIVSSRSTFPLAFCFFDFFFFLSVHVFLLFFSHFSFIFLFHMYLL